MLGLGLDFCCEGHGVGLGLVPCDLVNMSVHEPTADDDKLCLLSC